MSSNEVLNTQRTAAEVEPGRLPESVVRAMQLLSELPVTGYLCCALFDLDINCLVGVVYQESRGRFRDGATIRTSSLRRRFECDGYYLYETSNGSRYVVCEWSNDSSSPRFTGVRH